MVNGVLKNLIEQFAQKAPDARPEGAPRTETVRKRPRTKRDARLFQQTVNENARQALGQLGEMLACDYLRRNGYQILERNFRCSEGEIDIVAMQKECLCFIEIRTRLTSEYGHPIESIGFKKQQKIRRVARYYLSERVCRYQACRFDAVGIVLKEGEEAEVELVAGAF